MARGILFLVLIFLPRINAATPVKIVLVGDSTVNPEGGWGPGFRASFDKDVTVINLAANGRSSKSFRDENRWQPALDAKTLVHFDPVRPQ